MSDLDRVAEVFRSTMEAWAANARRAASEFRRFNDVMRNHDNPRTRRGKRRNRRHDGL